MTVSPIMRYEIQTPWEAKCQHSETPQLPKLNGYIYARLPSFICSVLQRLRSKNVFPFPMLNGDDSGSLGPRVFPLRGLKANKGVKAMLAIIHPRHWWPLKNFCE